MSRVVDWSKTYSNPLENLKRGKYSSGKEFFQQAYAREEEMRKAQETLQKALPVMQNILVQRMVERRPLKVIRPLQYTTEALNTEAPEDEDDFYSVKKSDNTVNANFKSVVRTIPPGTELTFMNLEKSLNQLWFKTNTGEEVGIYVNEQVNLLTQTDIYQLVSQHLENDQE